MNTCQHLPAEFSSNGRDCQPRPGHVPKACAALPGSKSIGGGRPFAPMRNIEMCGGHTHGFSTNRWGVTSMGSACRPLMSALIRSSLGQTRHMPPLRSRADVRTCQQDSKSLCAHGPAGLPAHTRFTVAKTIANQYSTAHTFSFSLYSTAYCRCAVCVMKRAGYGGELRPAGGRVGAGFGTHMHLGGWHPNVI